MSLYELLLGSDTSQNQEVLENGYSIEGVDPNLFNESEEELRFENPITGEVQTTRDPLELKQWQEAYNLNGGVHFEPLQTSYQALIDERQRIATDIRINKEVRVASENEGTVPDWMWKIYQSDPRTSWTSLRSRINHNKPEGWVDGTDTRTMWKALFTTWATCSQPYLNASEPILPYLTRGEVGDAELCTVYNTEYEDPNGETWAFNSWTDLDILKASLDPRYEESLEIRNQIKQQVEEDEDVQISLPKYNPHFTQLKKSRQLLVSSITRRLKNLPVKAYNKDGNLNRQLKNILSEVENLNRGTPLRMKDIYPSISEKLANIQPSRDTVTSKVVVKLDGKWFSIQESKDKRKLISVEKPENPIPLVKLNAKLGRAETQQLKASIVFMLVKKCNLAINEAISIAYSWSTVQGEHIKLSERNWLAYVPHTTGNIPWTTTGKYVKNLKKQVAIEMKKDYKETYKQDSRGNKYLVSVKVDQEVDQEVNKRLEVLVKQQYEAKVAIVELIQKNKDSLYKLL